MKILEHPWFKGIKWQCNFSDFSPLFFSFTCLVLLNEKPPIVPPLSSKIDTKFFRKIKDDLGDLEDEVDESTLDENDEFREFKRVEKERKSTPPPEEKQNTQDEKKSEEEKEKETTAEIGRAHV